MRIPIPWVIVLCLLAVVIPGWIGMRGKDFLSPPDRSTLDAVRTRAESALPRIATRADAITPKPDDAAQADRPVVVSLGNLARPPQLDEYADRSAHGSTHLIELASRLESAGHPPRALLAWERVIDHCAATDADIGAAAAAIHRLRADAPPWNAGREQPIAIVIHAGTARKSAEALAPILKQAAIHLSNASGGILDVDTRVNAGPDAEFTDSPVPVAIWITGSGDGESTTEVRSFNVSTPETLEYSAIRTIHALVRAHLRHARDLRPPPAPPDEGDAREALATHITRLHWREFGRLLNPTPN